ncbi:MAG: efflux RND transporter periplasmic adaptor subunit [Planctomycetaceae bacterium]|nr:efflux RND transporter periplasmic adaptor subunit [Planctomycetales bacterium]MCB9923415.1 efflux RND transporter periplasmic adaptor subunit [Planctomycetaceae bacterium]
MNLRVGLSVAVFVLAAICTVGSSASSLETEGVLTLLEEIRIPARDEGVLVEVLVRPGMNVSKEMPLARQDETEALATRDQASTELANASRVARNDLKIQLARKSHEVAAAELKRAIEAAERFSKSVSQSEIERLELVAEQADLQIYQARFDMKTAQLAVATHEAALQLAEHRLKKRTIYAPSSGVVVEVLKQTGEWVEPGETVLRIVRMDRLRVEAFFSAERANAQLVGRPAVIAVKVSPDQTIDIPGEVTFVSPEVHPINGMVRVWVEIENSEGKLRPGLQARIKIEP